MEEQLLLPMIMTSSASICAVNKNDLGKININTRVFGQIGFGTKLPSESMLFVVGANNEELMENKYTRAMGFIPPEWEDMEM